MIEIERKFLVDSTSFKKNAISKERIVQGFLNTHPNRTVRVRIAGDFGYLTIKGKSNPSGTSRFEWEMEITVEDAEQLLLLCEDGRIEKIRYKIPFEDHIFEVDEFRGDNKGLIIAELELENEHESFKKPNWLGDEVTGNVKYYNSHLCKKPFNSWKK
ncbi:MAG: CYTH domain-containing protein [Maribacter sp.]|nr:CYTH domain-containing protein [Maribacter sp.]